MNDDLEKCLNNRLKKKFPAVSDIVFMPNNKDEESPLDTQIGGDHYKKYKIQPLEFAMANGFDACQFNILKYIIRHKDKNGKEDLLKARHYLDVMIEYYYPTK